VLLAAVRGRSNGEMAADAVVLSEATIKIRVGRIVAKLEPRDRVQIVSFAYDRPGRARAGVARSSRSLSSPQTVELALLRLQTMVTIRHSQASRCPNSRQSTAICGYRTL
jgi:hypothetical protein